MSKIKHTAMTKDYASLRSESLRYGERGDCAVVAVAIVCDVSYEVAHATLKACGRKDRSGTYQATTHSAVAKLGKKLQWIDPRTIIAQYPGAHKNLKHVTTHHLRRFPDVWNRSKVYLMSVRGHILAVKGGEVHDWSANKAKQVHAMWEVI